MKNIITLILLLFFISCFAQTEDRTKNFPKYLEKVEFMPDRKENLWIFFMAGQSNMAGRGFVEPQDTISSYRIITINKNNEWVYAKEPLHFYEPNLTNLDSGLSFGRELSKRLRDSITIAIIPCAVGGSAIKQWLDDDVHRDVKLLSNFKEKVDLAKQYGTIKGILWHQGESDAKPSLLPAYKENLPKLFKIFRDYIGNDELPIMPANLGLFAPPQEQMKWDAINAVINLLPLNDRYVFPINSKDLTHKGDNLHFDSKSQRELGRRFAEQYIKIFK